jgi:hypothetical protein
MPTMTEHRSPPLQRMAAEILFETPDDMYRALPVLLEHDFEVRYLDGRFDPAGTPTVWLLAWTLTRLDDCAFPGFVDELVRPLGGLAHEFSVAHVSDAELAEWIAEETPSSMFLEPRQK